MRITYSRRKSMRCIWTSLVVLTCVACAALIYISLLFGKDYYSGRKKNFSKRPEKLTEEECIPVCNSEACMQHSHFLLNQVDTTADPCDNFYKFACGKYVGQFWNQSKTTVLEMESKMNRMLKSILENIDADPDSAFGKTKTMYDSCIKRSSSDIQAIPTLLQYLTRFGIRGWPNLDSSFKFDELSLFEVLGNLITYQEYAFVDIVGSYFDHYPYSLRNVTIEIAQSSYEKLTQNSTRKHLMTKILKYFNLDSEIITEIWEESEAILNAITDLKEESARIFKNQYPEEESSNEPEKRIFIDSVENEEAEWKPACGIFESFIHSADVGAVVSKKFSVYGSSVYFLQNLFSVLNNFTDRSVANYLAINMLFRHLKELNIYFQIAIKDDAFYLYISSIFPETIGGWEHCVELMVEYMYIPLGYMYVKEILNSPIMQEVNDIGKECIHISADAISEQNWMPEDIRMEYENETRNIEYNTNNIPEKTNETLLDKAYEQFHPTEVSFLENVLEYKKFLKINDLLGFLKEANVDRVRPEILKPDASSSGFGINLFLGNTMPPFYRVGLPRIINLVTISTILGHEVGHSLDFKFRGNKHKHPAIKEYMDKTLQCVKNQYSQFTYEFIEKKINGSQFIIENMADTAGIFIIDKIIERYSSEEDTFSLPGFPYSMKQFLYISAVQEWCHSFTKKDEEDNYRIGFHGIRYLRILGMMQNSRGFAEAFKCSEGSFMNPSTKCLFPG